MNEKLRALVKEKFINHKDRYLHICGVEEVSIELAGIYDVPVEKASIAALTHDILKYEPVLDQVKYLDEDTILKFKDIPVMYHAYAAAAFIEKELHITDHDIIDAVKYHIWGRPNMRILEKIIYVADFAEPNRAFEEAKKIREIAKKDLDLALVLAMKSSINYLIEKGIKPSIEQYEAFHYYEEVTCGKIKQNY